MAKSTQPSHQKKPLARPRAKPRVNPKQFLQLLRRRRWIAAIVITMFSGLAIFADRQGWLLQTGGDWNRYHGQTFHVVKVIDGDTVDINVPDGKFHTTRLRLWGIDSPETAKPDKGLEAEPYADVATDFTRELCLNKAVTLRLESHRLRGKYGRVLAYIELPDGSLLNERLLAAGLARADQRFGHRLNERFTFIEKQARHDRVGLWSK